MDKRHSSSSDPQAHSYKPSPLEVSHHELLLQQLRESQFEPPVLDTKGREELRLKMDKWEAVYHEMREVQDHLARAYSDLTITR